MEGDLPEGYTEVPIDSAPAADAKLPDGFTEIPVQQYLSNPAIGAPDVTSKTGAAYNPDQAGGGAGFGATLLASLQPDVQKKIKVYADARGLPLERYGVDKEGNIIYFDHDGKLKFEEPTVGGGSFVSDPLGWFARLGHQIGASAGQAIPAAGGVLGEVTAGPGGAVAGAAAGDTLRQEVGNIISGFSPKDVDFANVAGQGATGGAGSILGRFAPQAVNGIMNFGKNKMLVGRDDLGMIADPANQAIYAQRAADARALGIPMTPGNITGAPSLLARERQLKRFPESTDIMGNFLADRNEEKVPRAIGNVIAPQFPGAAGHVQGAYDMQQGAQAVIETLEHNRTAAASPDYLNAFRSGTEPDVSPVLNQINTRLSSGELSPTLRDTLNEARSMIAEERPVLDPQTGNPALGPDGRPQTEWVPFTNYARLHNGKMEMDGIIQALANKNPAPNIVKSAERELTPIQQSLTQALRDAHPDYEAGYQKYIAASAPIEQARSGLVGLMANPDRVRNFSNVPGIIGSGGDPQSITAARDLFHGNGQGEAWDRGVASYLQNGLEQAQRVTQAGSPSNVAGKYYQAMFGDGPLRDNLRAATTPTQYTAMERLFNSLRLAANSPAEGSATATDVGTKAQLASGWAKVVGAVVKGINPFEIPEHVGAYIQNRSAQKNAASLAELFTNQGSIDELLKLRALRPTSDAALRVITNALSKAGIQYEATNSGKPPAQTPPILLRPFAANASSATP